MEQWQTKTLPEETAEYFIYAFPRKDKAGSAVPDTIHQTLKDVKKAASKLVDEHLKGYIWQREPFKLDLQLKAKNSKAEELALSHLYGRTNFGDAIEDEWLIVWLLRTLSTQFPQIWIRVTDSMGEFLLVEAANVLPGWLDPDIAEHRVWINKGELRLIPVVPPSKSGLASGQPSSTSHPGAITLDDARQFIFDGRPTLHPGLVETEAFHRLRSYPAQISRNQHHSLIIVPRKLAFVLRELPTSITSAIDAFYLRDPISLRPLHAPDSSQLIFPPKDFVTLRTKFTRVSFAQARAQRFERPPAWSDADDQYDDAKHWNRADTGTKVCAGYEMLLSDPQRQDERVVREIRVILEDLERGDVELPNDDEIRASGIDEDSEKWMDIDFQDFEDELSGRRSGKKGTQKSVDEDQDDAAAGFGDKAAQAKLRKMVQRFDDFLKDDTLDAYDVDDDDDDDDDSDDDSEDDDDDDDDDDDLEKGDASAPFTEDDFTKMMREMMGIPADVMQEIMTAKLDEADVREFAKAKRAESAATTSSADPSKGKGKELAGANSIPHEAGTDDEEDEEIRQLTAAMEAELRSSGALSLAGPKEGKRVARIKDGGASMGGDEDDAQDSEDDPELLDEDYNLVSNMLESFKGQAGMAGPGGNLMGLLGVKMPRDEGDQMKEEEEVEDKGGRAIESAAASKSK